MHLSLAGDFWFKKRFHSRFLVLEQHLFSIEIEFQRNFHLAGISFRDLVLERTLNMVSLLWCYFSLLARCYFSLFSLGLASSLF